MCKRDCIYAGPQNIHIGAGEHCCDYVLAMMGTEREQKTRFGQLVKKYRLPPTHRKIRLLMMGENCQFYEPVNYDRLRELYDQGLNDTQIYRITGTSKDAIRKWRKSTGLKANWRTTE